jgi:predicted GNAT superfamily acetyltransferase
MRIEKCSKADFDLILTETREFWGSDRTLALHNPILLNEFGNSAFVIRESGKAVAYLFGFLSQTEPTGYIHLIGVRPSHRRRGFAKALYAEFENFAKSRGCAKLKAITTPTNKDSLAFHKSIGMLPVGAELADGVPVVRNYSGPGLDRVVMEKRI